MVINHHLGTTHYYSVYTDYSKGTVACFPHVICVFQQTEHATPCNPEGQPRGTNLNDPYINARDIDAFSATAKLISNSHGSIAAVP
jgi:hypothetical protein